MEHISPPPLPERAVIAGCARNVAHYLGPVFSNIETLSRMFSSTALVVHSDPSEDETLGVLKSMQRRFAGQMTIIEGHLDMALPQTIRLARCRNEILDLMADRYGDYDYYICLDMDDVCTQPLMADVIHGMLRRSDWDAVSFDRNFYFDLWALSFEPYIHNYFGHRFHTTGHRIAWLIDTIRRTISEKLRALRPSELLPVYSAFNGFAMYRMSKIRSCRYDGERQIFFTREQYTAYERETGLRINPDYKYNCEHIAFHWDMLQNHAARIRISPHRAFRFVDHEKYIQRIHQDESAN
jgi:hypothetical protein